MNKIKFMAWTGVEVVHVSSMQYEVSESSMIGNNCWLPHTLMQYTGKKDKNGKEIYKSYLLKSGKTGLIYKVEWDDENAAWHSLCTDQAKDFCLMPWSWDESEIVGNIYENPELLT